MDSRSLSEQEKDIRDLLRRAERTPVKTSALRRDTLKKLIDLAHSPHSSLKIVAATNLKLFIKDFPDLEDDAINAVYDLCEDPVSNVRIKGYAAIVDVSREQNKWVKRNADVLVQLLQSDEPEEVTFVKRALTQHLDMDPVVTLGVLCDQIVPPEEPLDEEEQSIRDRLRSLVLAFLAGEAKRPLVERHANAAGTPAEQVLVPGLFKAITKLSPAEVDTIVKDIIAGLPSFRSYSTRGKELLDLLLGQIRATLKTDLPAGEDNATLEGARYYLDLKRLVHPSHLLRFYYASLTPKAVIRRLMEEDQAYVISEVARLVVACEESPKAPPTAPAADLGKAPGGVPSAADEAALRRQFPDVCAVLLETFCDMRSHELRPWTACLTLVQGIVRSLLEPVKSSAPATPSKTSTTDADAQKGNVKPKVASRTGNGNADAVNGTAGDRASAKGDQRRVMNVSKRKHEDPSGTAMPSGGPSGSRGSADVTAPERNGSYGRPATLPPRPSAATVASSSGAPSGPRADRQRERQPPPHLKGKAPRSPPVTSATPASAAGPSTNGASTAATATGSARADDASPRSAKKARTEERGGRGGGDMSGLGSTPNGGKAAAPPPGTGAGKGKGAQASSSPKAEEAKPVPSLLSRLAGGPANGTSSGASSAREREQSQRERDRGGQGRRSRRGRSGDRDSGRGSDLSGSATMPSIPAKRRADESSFGPLVASSMSHSSTAPAALGRPRQQSPDRVPVGGYSIRGAAKAVSRGSPGPGDGAGSRGPGSLLERMQALGDGRRRKRTKHS
ncbi:hypothetical protein C8T65DRAFT_649312 [Cerioporus squamosus]|nr:hypothetical protein C8T65DRAFT_649312 [Cerioporus squamosus]